jgi:hypothetical protein
VGDTPRAARRSRLLTHPRPCLHPPAPVQGQSRLDGGRAPEPLILRLARSSLVVNTKKSETGRGKRAQKGRPWPREAGLAAARVLEGSSRRQ